jgi:hypothetical protein
MTMIKQRLGSKPRAGKMHLQAGRRCSNCIFVSWARGVMGEGKVSRRCSNCIFVSWARGVMGEGKVSRRCSNCIFVSWARGVMGEGKVSSGDAVSRVGWRRCAIGGGDALVPAVGELAGLAYIQVGALFDLIFASFFSR